VLLQEDSAEPLLPLKGGGARRKALDTPTSRVGVSHAALSNAPKAKSPAATGKAKIVIRPTSRAPTFPLAPPGRRRIMTGVRSAGRVIQGGWRERNLLVVGDETCSLGSGTKTPVVKNPLTLRTRRDRVTQATEGEPRWFSRK
jgi:hypothetical protein